MFAPDLIAMLDVDPRERLRWVVSHEGKGLDFALEITLSGDRRKDLELNVDRFARLGIPEYFVLDLKYHRILGYRLGAAMSYEPIVPQLGRWPSRVLGLDLGLEHDRVRFYSGSARLPDSEELIGRLEGMVDTLVAKEEALAQFEAEKARTEEEKARAEEERARANRLAARLRELGVEVDES
jgi:hypothetical protein